MKTELNIRGMHCAACAARLTEAFRALPGVRAAQVSLEESRALLESDRALPVEELERAARGAGNYSVAPVGAAAPVEKGTLSVGDAVAEASTTDAKPSLYPLFLIVAYIAATAALADWRGGAWSWHAFMNDFMAGFFLVFSFFKLLDLRGFAGTYRTYDLIARLWPSWGLVYPFVELALGVAYLARFEPVITNWVTLALMLAGAAGVFRALSRKDAVRCACLGTVLNLPMTTVTLMEDLGMAGMAAAGLLWH